MPEFVAAIDQGTTSTRCMIFDHAGNERARHQLEHAQLLPRSGWVEHDPVEIWQRSQDVLHAAIDDAGLAAGDIAALGITNQRETAVVWNRRTGQPYYNAIVWQDTRTDRIAAALERDGRGEVIRARAGLPPATYFAAGKVQWMLDNVDGLRAAAEAGDAVFGTIDSWLLWNLTGGGHVTDVTNASRTMLMDLRTLDWDDELLSFFGIPAAMLPEIRPSADPAGYGEVAIAGPARGIVLTGALGDQQAATVGQVCFAPGEAKNTYGTGNFLLLNTGTEPVASEHGLLTTVCYQFGDDRPVYALEGSIAVTGSAVQWLRDQLASSPPLPRSRRWQPGWTTPAGRTSSRRSPACSPRTGDPMPGARSSGCRATTPERIWPGLPWRRSATRAAMSSRRWRGIPGSAWTCSRWTAG